MTNETISAILDHISHQARNTVHATYGAIELIRKGTGPSVVVERTPAIETDVSDRLLRFIDDVRELVSVVPPAPLRLEDFDLALTLSGIVDALNFAAQRPSRQIVIDTIPNSLGITQDRGGVEAMLTRLLKTSFSLSRNDDLHVRLAAAPEQSASSIVATRDEALASKMIHWLTADPAEAMFPDRDDVEVGIAIMLAGKHLWALGGSVELDRDAAGYSTLAIHLPSQQRRNAVGPLRCDPEALNVLVVEDSDESFVLSEVALENECVSRAHDGLEALHKIHKHRFDLVLMDIHMPGMNGYEAIRSIRDWETENCNARTPIVVLSSDDLTTQRESAARCGCSGFLRKPLHRSELVSVLDSLKKSRVLA